VSRLDLIVGPNGAGKSTLFAHVIEPDRPGLPFVNADRIAAERFGPDAEARSYEAAEIAARARSALIDARLDFCTETVFSHESKLELIATAGGAGYDIVLHVVLIPAGLSGPRVAARVATGGHSVPEEKIRSRYERIWPLVAAAVPMVRDAIFWDNSTVAGPIEVATFRRGLADSPPRWPTWCPPVIAALGTP
jgi:predicted ABC-type ATPase